MQRCREQRPFAAAGSPFVVFAIEQKSAYPARLTWLMRAAGAIASSTAGRRVVLELLLPSSSL